MVQFLSELKPKLASQSETASNSSAALEPAAEFLCQLKLNPAAAFESASPQRSAPKLDRESTSNLGTNSKWVPALESVVWFVSPRDLNPAAAF
jgi:hypothetical protein